LEKITKSINLALQFRFKMGDLYKILTLIILLIPQRVKSDNQSVINDSIVMQNYYSSALKLYSGGFYIQALDTLSYAFETGKKIYPENHYNLRNINNALGITFRTIGQYDKAIEHFLLAEQSYLAEKEINEAAIARLYNNIGNVYFDRFNYGTALEYYQRAFDVFHKQKEKDTKGIADICYSIANTHYEMGNNEEALDIILKYQNQAEPLTLLYYLSLRAATLHMLKKNEEAYKSYNETIKYAKKLYSETDINIVFEYLNFATFLISTNNFVKAHEVLNNADRIFTSNNIKEGTTLALFYKTYGLYYENLNIETKNISFFREQKVKNLLQSIDFYKKGLEALKFDLSVNYGPKTTAGNLSLTQSLDLLKLIADTYVLQGELLEDKNNDLYREAVFNALDYYKIISELIQRARKEIYTESDKIQLSEIERSTFIRIIQTAYKSYTISGDTKIAEFAFQNSEKLKSTSLFDRLTDQLAKENSLIPDSLTELENKMNFSITSYNEQLYNLTSSNSVDTGRISEVETILFDLKRQKEELNRYLELNYNDYYNFKYSENAITIEDIKKTLDNNHILIEYVLNRNDSLTELYAFCISNVHFEFKKLDIRDDFNASVDYIFRFLSNPDFLLTGESESKDYCVAAFNLYTDLINPFEKVIMDKNLIIIPSGELSYIPFDALIQELPDTTERIEFNRLSYLIISNSINYAYSANLMINFNNHEISRKNSVLAFAPEYKYDTVAFDDQKLILMPLEGTKREVDLISKEIKTRKYMGEEATEFNFRNNCKNYDILHLAAHAFINDSLPGFSRFAFFQNHSDSLENDGWLNTADIYNLDLNSRLTVLSSCNTGSGEYKSGEGVMSLARGFFYAGCPSIVMTLWEVDDISGTKIMASFYRNLKKGKAIDEALRLAKLEYLELANNRMAHPHYWLGYVMIGDTTPVSRSYDYYFLFLVIIVLLGIMTDQFLRSKRQAKNKNQFK